MSEEEKKKETIKSRATDILYDKLLYLRWQVFGNAQYFDKMQGEIAWWQKNKVAFESKKKKHLIYRIYS